MADVSKRVEAHLCSALGEPDARASVTFLGTERIDLLRFLAQDADGQGDGGIVRYVTLGMSAAPMTDPAAALADPERGPRAELILSVRTGAARTDEVLRPLAVLAASPQVEGGEPLWPGAPFTSVLVAESGGLVGDLELDAPLEPVRFLPLLPMTPNEAAWKRARGAEALEERWLRHGTDLRDPLRGPVPLDG
jgi:hypothetical protein